MTATATACHCPRCVIDRAGVAGPFTPDEFKALGLERHTVAAAHDDPVGDDPGVKAAQLAVREAREAYEPFERAWLEVVAAHHQADMAEPDQHYSDGRGGLLSLGGRRRLARVGELARKRKEAREAMELAWKDVVKANDDVRDALLAARVRVVEAEREAG